MVTSLRTAMGAHHGGIWAACQQEFTNISSPVISAAAPLLAVGRGVGPVAVTVVLP